MKNMFKSLLCAAMVAVPVFAMSVSGEAESEREYIRFDEWEAYFNADDSNTVTIVWYFGEEAEITIPESLGGLAVTGLDGVYHKDFGYWSNDKVTKITIPASVSKISPNQESNFAHLSKLTAFAVSSENPYYTAEDGILYTKDKKKIVSYPAGKTEKSFSIPSGVTEIEEYCFCKCTALSSVTIPSSVIVINNDAFSCSGITEFTVPATVTEMGSNVFEWCNCLEKVTIDASLKELPEGAFRGDDALVDVTLPKTLTSIGADAFLCCESLQSISLPYGVTSIGDNAFLSCRGLQSIKIPETVKTIGSWAFDSCDSLRSITIPKSLTEMGQNPFAFCSLTINVADGNTAFTIENGVLFDAKKTRIIDYSEFNTANTYTIPSTVTSIDDGAFSINDALTSMVLPPNVNKIGKYIFLGCENLSSVEITGNVTEIPCQAFTDCYNLSNLVIPNSVTDIDTSAVASCHPDLKILYGGTEEEWKNIKVENFAGQDNVEVICNHLLTPQPKKITNVVSGAHVYWWDIGTTNVGRYDVYRSETPSGGYTLIGKTTASNYTDTTAESGKTYYYKIRAARGNVKSDASKAVSTVFVDTPDITSRVNKAAGVTLGWNKITGATGYAIFRKGDSASETWKRVATLDASTLSWTDTSVKSANGTIYHYTIRALAGSNKSILSGCRNTGRTVVRLSSPVLSSAAKASSTSVKAAWGKNTAADGYEVRVMNGTTVIKTVTVTNNATVTASVTGLTAGKTYKVQIRSYKNVGGVKYYSAWSEGKNVALCSSKNDVN